MTIEISYDFGIPYTIADKFSRQGIINDGNTNEQQQSESHRGYQTESIRRMGTNTGHQHPERMAGRKRSIDETGTAPQQRGNSSPAVRQR